MQGLWIGPELSPMEALSIRSFLAHGHEYHLYTYGHVSNVPEGTVVKDANAIIPFDKVFKYRDYDSYSGFSNHFRYQLLQLRGGWWVDLDLICLKPFDFESDYVFSSEEAQPSEGSGRLVNVGARSALAPTGGAVGYTIAKAGIAAMTVALADELAADGIRVNAVLPATIDTPANRAAMPGADPSRWRKPAEIAATIAWLISPANTATSGGLIPV